MEIGLLIIRLALAMVFGIAAMAKLFDRAGLEKALADFGVPKPLIGPFVYLLPLAELLLAVSLLFVEVSWFGAIGSAALFGVFTAGMLYQLAKGNAPDCHCFGQIHNEPVGVTSVVRNVVLIGLAAILIAQGRSFQGVSLVNSNQDIMQFIIGIAIVGLLGAVVFFLKRISEQQVQIMRRIELMELVSQEGGSVERKDVALPHDGLPIGGHFPEFELTATNGEMVSLSNIKDLKKAALFFFISPTCNPCKALLPEFDRWQNDLAGKVEFIFVSSGKAKDNIEKFGSDRRILLQKARELADPLKAQWTPTAVLMDAAGRVASHIAAGDSAIRSLVEQIKTEDLAQEFTHFASIDGHSHENKIGRDVPQFKVEDIKGKEITTDYFKGKQTLVTFWSHTCGFCQSMIEDLREWDKTRGKDDPDLILFSDGDKEKNESLGLRAPIIVDEHFKTANGFGMFGTPSAVLINEKGQIVSETAVGAPNIWSLVGRKK